MKSISVRIQYPDIQTFCFTQQYSDQVTASNIMDNVKEIFLHNPYYLQRVHNLAGKSPHKEDIDHKHLTDLFLKTHNLFYVKISKGRNSQLIQEYLAWCQQETLESFIKHSSGLSPTITGIEFKLLPKEASIQNFFPSKQKSSRECTPCTLL